MLMFRDLLHSISFSQEFWWNVYSKIHTPSCLQSSEQWQKITFHSSEGKASHGRVENNETLLIFDRNGVQNTFGATDIQVCSLREHCGPNSALKSFQWSHSKFEPVEIQITCVYTSQNEPDFIRRLSWVTLQQPVPYLRPDWTRLRTMTSTSPSDVTSHFQARCSLLLASANNSSSKTTQPFVAPK